MPKIVIFDVTKEKIVRELQNGEHGAYAGLHFCKDGKILNSFLAGNQRSALVIWDRG